MRKVSLYIHIPFCRSKCSYCDFYSVLPEDIIIDRYVEQLLLELSYYADNDIIIDTIYLGGGTPSILPLVSIEKISNYIFSNFACDITEFTIEVNPCSSTDIECYKNVGINRISLGVQSLDDNILRILSRQHNAMEALKALEKTAKHFDNVSADLIIGVTDNQKVGSDIDKIKDLVEHISAYMLKVEEGTPLYRQKQLCAYIPLNDDSMAQQYDELYQALYARSDLRRYEISNFAVRGYESKHNLKYWQLKEYIGIGASAYSYFSQERYHNKSSINDYLKGYHIANDKHILDDTDELSETIMLGLRLEKGINIDYIDGRFSINFYKKYRKQLDKLASYLTLKDNTVRIKPEYMLLQNAIVREFI